MLEKSTESIVDGEKDKHMDNREHQTGMDVLVPNAALSYIAYSYIYVT